MKTILLAALLSACIDTEFHSPELGTTYSCKSQIICDGHAYGVTPATGCALDEEDAAARFEVGMTKWLYENGGHCDTLEFINIECRELGERCTVDQ